MRLKFFFFCLYSLIFFLGVIAANRVFLPRLAAVHKEAFFEASEDWIDIKGKVVSINKSSYRLIKSNPNKITVFFGDSHSAQYYPRISKLLIENKKLANSVIFLSTYGCTPFSGVINKDSMINKQLKKCSENFLNLKSLIRENTKIQNLVVSFCWACLLIKEENKLDKGYYKLINNEYKSLVDPAIRNEIILEFIKQIKFIVNKNDIKIWILIDNPIGDNLNPINFIQNDRFNNFAQKKYLANYQLPEKQIQLHKELINLFKKHNLKVIDPFDLLCKKNICRVFDKNYQPIYKDSDHLRASFVANQAKYIDVTLGFYN